MLAATTAIYTLSLHDALPIFTTSASSFSAILRATVAPTFPAPPTTVTLRFIATPRLVAGPLAPLLAARSEEHTSELQSRLHLVCRLLLEKKKQGSPAEPRRAG